jgi:hypothetical protein
MSQIFAILLLLSLSSCELLLSPPMVALEEEVAMEVLEEIEQEIETLEK